MHTMSIMDKINSYSSLSNLFNWNLWFSSSNTDVSNYAQTVGSAQNNPLGNKAVVVYGKIGPDDEKITFRNNETGEIEAVYDMVNSPPEYYFTDMVFIQQKYEEALVDLYFFRAEAAWSRDHHNNRPAVDEAIAGTYWVAQQNGVSYTEEQIQAKFMEQLDEQLIPITKGFIDDMEDRFSDIERYTDILNDRIRAYYLEPNINTFEDLIRSAYSFEEAAGTVYLNIRSIFSRTVGLLSSGLATALLSHARENQDRLSLAPQVISPVEISQAEQELVFGGND